MSTFKLIALPLFVLIFGLTALSTTYASNPMILNESTISISGTPKVWIALQHHFVSVNTPVDISAKVNAAGDLTKLSLIIKGVEVASGSDYFLTTNYLPTTPGRYLIMAKATYSDHPPVRSFTVLTVN